MFSFMLRIFYAQGWYIVTYALAIYHLNLFLAFLTPKMDPAMAEMEDEDGPDVLPTKQTKSSDPSSVVCRNLNSGIQPRKP